MPGDPLSVLLSSRKVARGNPVQPIPAPTHGRRMPAHAHLPIHCNLCADSSLPISPRTWKTAILHQRTACRITFIYWEYTPNCTQRFQGFLRMPTPRLLNGEAPHRLVGLRYGRAEPKNTSIPHKHIRTHTLIISQVARRPTLPSLGESSALGFS